MRVNPFDIFARPEVPDSAGLIAGAACKDAFVGGMPHRLVRSVIVGAGVQSTTCSHGLRVPDLDSFVHGGAQDHALVNVVPLATLNLGGVPSENGDRLRASQLKQFKSSIATCLKNMLLIGF